MASQKVLPVGIRLISKNNDMANAIERDVRIARMQRECVRILPRESNDMLEFCRIELCDFAHLFETKRKRLTNVVTNKALQDKKTVDTSFNFAKA